jgi:hypothetical protein
MAKIFSIPQVGGLIIATNGLLETRKTEQRGASFESTKKLAE